MHQGVLEPMFLIAIGEQNLDALRQLCSDAVQRINSFAPPKLDGFDKDEDGNQVMGQAGNDWHRMCGKSVRTVKKSLFTPEGKFYSSLLQFLTVISDFPTPWHTARRDLREGGVGRPALYDLVWLERSPYCETAQALSAILGGNLIAMVLINTAECTTLCEFNQRQSTFSNELRRHVLEASTWNYLRGNHRRAAIHIVKYCEFVRIGLET